MTPERLNEIEKHCAVNPLITELVTAIRELQRHPQNDPDYVLINTPELKRLYAPKQATDEFLNGQWMPVPDNETGFQHWEYRRPRHLAWLEIAKVPVQYPAWILLGNGERFYADDPNDLSAKCAKSWQPAPSAPKPPVDDEKLAFARAHVAAMETLNEPSIKQFKSMWQAGR